MNKLKCCTCGKLTDGTVLHVPVGEHIELKGFDISVDISTKDSFSVLCKRCIIDAIKRLDDREKESPEEEELILGFTGVMEAISKHLSESSIAAINTADDMSGECHCEDQYTVEPHGDKFAVYFGRCPHRHGQRILSFMPDGGDVVTGEATTVDSFQFKAPEWQATVTDWPEAPEVNIPEINIPELPTFEAPAIPSFKTLMDRQKIIDELSVDLERKDAEISSLKKQLEDHKDAIFFYREANKLFKSAAKDAVKSAREKQPVDQDKITKILLLGGE